MWEEINISPNISREEIVVKIREIIDQLGYQVVDEDVDRPWGGYWRFDEKFCEDFQKRFFPDVKIPDWAVGLEFSPKFLVVAPHKQLSWQYHKLRGELWKILRGPVITYLSPTDDLPQNKPIYQTGDFIEIQVTTRHRMAGMDNWGIWAEMWMHVDPNHPSSEHGDIYRLQDDFGRK